MDEEKRKRLEILKMKNQNLKNELNKIATASDYASNASSTIAPSVAMLKKESLVKADLNLEEIKKSAGLLKGVMQKYRSENLSTFFMSETILGMLPEAYEEGVQCDIEKELKNDSDNEEHNAKPTSQKGYRKSIMPANKSKINVNSWGQKIVEGMINFHNEDLNYTKQNPEEKEDSKPTSILKSGNRAISEEMRRQILNSHELSEFLSHKSRYVERVILHIIILNFIRLLAKKKFSICLRLIMMRRITLMQIF
jgi:hypothetical protein